MATTPRQTAANPALSVRPDTMQLSGILRADKIRHDTLVQLVQHWDCEEARADIIAQLDALAEAVNYPRDGELDSLIENVETAASMDDAEISVGLHDFNRLHGDVDRTQFAINRFGKQA